MAVEVLAAWSSNRWWELLPKTLAGEQRICLPARLYWPLMFR